MIVFDANQLPSPHSPMLAMLKAAASRSGHTLATTDIVAKEWINRQREDITKRISALRKAQTDLNRLLPLKSAIGVDKLIWPLEGNLRSNPNPVVVKELEKDLRQAYRILETHPDDALEALYREAERKTPCSKGRGGRDAAIYLTATRAVEDTDATGRPLPLIFVSRDNGFTDPEEPGSLHPELHEGLGVRKVILCQDVASVLAEIGYPQVEIDASEITGMADFLEIVRNAMIGAYPEYKIPDSNFYDNNFEVEFIKPREGGDLRALQCKSDGFTLTTVTGKLKIRVTSGLASERIRERDPDARTGFFVSADLMILVVQDADGNIVDVNFISLILDRSPQRTFLTSPVLPPGLRRKASPTVEEREG